MTRTAEDLFWALTDLTEIDLPNRVVRCGIDGDGLTVIADGRATARYRTAEQTGHLPAELLADRPIEERGRTHWRVTWALPVGADAGSAGPVGPRARCAGRPGGPTDDHRRADPDG